MSSKTTMIIKELEAQEYQRHHRSIAERSDRIFGVLMVVQFIALIAAAVWLSPLTWSGPESSIHNHVWASIAIGGLATLFPASLCYARAGATSTRYVVATGQMAVSCLLIHILGGRIEAHFHVFGSLAFLAIYRDWRVVILGTFVITADHVLRAVYWPESIFGVDQPAFWRAIEHAGWVIFEDVILLISIRQNVLEMQDLARQKLSIAMCARSIDEHSNHFAASSGALADGARHQNDSVHQISDAVDELNRLIYSVKESARTARNTVAKANTLAAQCEARIATADESMRQLQSSVSQISTSITEIRKISEQTNLLALNASIEAARAGESGRGFAVVAGEVKDLARRAESAASFIATLSDQSNTHVEEHTEASEQLAEQLQRIIEAVQSANDQIGRIADDSDVQVIQAESVASSIAGVAEISQSALSDSTQLADRSTHLRDRAKHLEELAGRQDLSTSTNEKATFSVERFTNGPMDWLRHSDQTADQASSA